MKQGRPTLLSLLLVLLLILLGAHSSLTSKQDGSNYLEKGRWDMGRYERERIRTEDTQDRDSKRKGSITQRLDEHRKDEVKERDVLEIKEKNTENNRSKKLDKRENERNSRKGSLKLKEGVDKNKYLKHKSWATEVKRSMTKNKGSEKSKKITEEINSSRKTKEKMNVIQKDYDKHKKERGKSVLGESTFKQNLKDSKRENALFKNSGKVKNARNSEKKENKIGKSEKDEIIDKSKKIKNENKFGKANTLESEGEESIDKKSGNSNIYRGKINKIKKSEEKESINPKKGKERSYTKATANTKHISKPEQREKKMNDTGRKQIFQRFREVEDKQNIKMNKKQMNGKLRVKLKEENKANNEKQRIKILKNKNNKKYKGTILPAQDDIDGDRRIKLSTKTAKIYQKLAAEKRKKMTNTNKDRNDNSPMYQVSRCKATHILALNQPILFNTDGEKTARKCRVTFKGPPGSTLKVVCPVFNLAAKGCGAEKLHFKEPGFKKKFCKREEVLVETKGNILTILHSRKKHDKKHCPGVFVCQVVVATETVRTTINVSITTISSTTEMSVLPGPLFCHSCTRGHISLSRIIGGEIVDVGEFPWQVRLNIQPGIMCSGTLIGPSWVLTAAHCFPDGRLIETEVSLGDHDLGVVEPGSVVTRAKSVVVHQEFDSFSMNNDIAVLELQEPVTFTDRIKPICLATLEETPNNGLAVSSGWGHQSYGGSKSDILQKVTLDVITNEYCDTLYAGFYEITENMICTYTQNKDACQGDSGGPLVAQIGGYWKLIGTVSFGYRCAWKESPGIFARVAKYIDWIASHTYKETC
ncbi:uncharacterized protein LOC121858311 isoform X2 [Homarus americanus]|uniref:uncharacterized protein LOC121858311 isoform X2 n=1 Tax=Homarus americanus TaxID=6706 RepID=UPI001C48EFBA|nr:uncharacterized protein LOC121858311 isoform X2 [Homarus americanus]